MSMTRQLDRVPGVYQVVGGSTRCDSNVLQAALAAQPRRGQICLSIFDLSLRARRDSGVD